MRQRWYTLISVSCLQLGHKPTFLYFFLLLHLSDYFASYTNYPSVTHLDCLEAVVVDARSPSREAFFFSELLDPAFSGLSPFAAISRITADRHNKEARKHGKPQQGHKDLKLKKSRCKS
jgi:hypothetical protein